MREFRGEGGGGVRDGGRVDVWMREFRGVG